MYLHTLFSMCSTSTLMPELAKGSETVKNVSQPGDILVMSFFKKIYLF